jgi:N-acetylmuramoyl-L-alanine amidase
MNIKKLKAIFIVAGHWTWQHGEIDSGASINWFTERRLTTLISEKLVKRLKIEDVFDWCWIYDVWVFNNLSLKNKISHVNTYCKAFWLNETNCILFSIHINAWWWHGVEVYHQDKDVEWIILSASISKNIANTTWLKNRWNKSEAVTGFKKLWILSDIKVLENLIECWFIDSNEDMKILNDVEWQELIVDWILDWLCEYLEAELTPEEPEQERIFDDVFTEDPFFDAVMFVKDQWILRGEWRLFEPQRQVTRSELAVVSQRLFQKLNSLIKEK